MSSIKVLLWLCKHSGSKLLLYCKCLKKYMKLKGRAMHSLCTDSVQELMNQTFHGERCRTEYGPLSLPWKPQPWEHYK